MTALATIRLRWPDDPATLDEVMTAVEALRQEVARLREATPQQFVDLKAAAEHLGVTERTVKRWVAEAGCHSAVWAGRCGFRSRR